MILLIIDRLFFAYTLLIAARLIGSWFPNFARSSLLLFIARFTDPYLNVFRRLIPPIGGTFDLSPMLAFFVLKLLATATKTVVIKVLA